MRDHRVVVLGAGYAGLVAAKRLARQVCPRGASVTLVNAAPAFVERIRLHQVAAGQRVADLPLADLLAGSGAELVVDTVRSIDLERRRVRLDETELAYDTLVYGLGSVTTVDGVPGGADHAVAMSGPEAANALARRLTELGAGVVAVCGSGPTGVEVATELAESYVDLTVRLVGRDEPGAALSPRAREYLGRELRRLGVEVTTAEVAAVEPGGVRLAGGDLLRADVTVWGGGFAVPELASAAGIAVNERGRVLVDETLRSVSHQDVYAVGDAVAAAGRWGAELSYGCRSGGFTGPYVADAIAARLAGREPKRFRFRYLHQCLSLGRRRGLIQFVHGRDESPTRFTLRGRPAAWYKEIVSSSAVVLFRHPGPYLPGRRR